MSQQRAILSYAIDVILGTALLITALITIHLLFTRNIETVMIVAPWALIIVLTMRLKAYVQRLRVAEAQLAARPRPAVVTVADRNRSGGN